MIVSGRLSVVPKSFHHARANARCSARLTVNSRLVASYGDIRGPVEVRIRFGEELVRLSASQVSPPVVKFAGESATIDVAFKFSPEIVCPEPSVGVVSVAIGTLEFSKHHEPWEDLEFFRFPEPVEQRLRLMRQRTRGGAIVRPGDDVVVVSGKFRKRTGQVIAAGEKSCRVDMGSGDLTRLYVQALETLRPYNVVRVTSGPHSGAVGVVVGSRPLRVVLDGKVVAALTTHDNIVPLAAPRVDDIKMRVVDGENAGRTGDDPGRPLERGVAKLPPFDHLRRAEHQQQQQRQQQQQQKRHHRITAERAWLLHARTLSTWLPLARRAPLFLKLARRAQAAGLDALLHDLALHLYAPSVLLLCWRRRLPTEPAARLALECLGCDVALLL